MANLHLPPLPDSITFLSDEDAERIDKGLAGQYSTPADCPTCKGEKQFRWYRYLGAHDGDPRHIETYDCSCEDQWMALRYMLNSGIDIKYQRYSLEDISSTEPGHALRQYVDRWEGYLRGGIGMMMTGSYGNGKSLTAALLAKALIQFGVKVHFATFNEMLNYFAAGWKDASARDWFSNKVRSAHVLFIDDLGKEMHSGVQMNTTNLARGQLDDILRHRVSMSLPTVITTNDPMEEINKAYGMNIFSLMEESMIKVVFQGVDWRPKAKLRWDQEIDSGLTRPIVFA